MTGVLHKVNYASAMISQLLLSSGPLGFIGVLSRWRLKVRIGLKKSDA